MKITLFTSNQSRHNYFINLLSEISTELYVVQENDTIFPGIITGHYPANETYKKYFSNVVNAQLELFGENYISINKKKINLLSMQEGDLNKCSMDYLSKFLKSDIYIVTGASFIKNELADFLISKKAISIHMGLAPYYRGTDCNFWALHDGNPHLVGATVYMLSKGLDTGKILYHAISENKKNSFIYTMSSVLSAFNSIAERIKNNSIFKQVLMEQDKSKEIRYSKKVEFNEKVINDFFNKSIDLNSKKLNIDLYKDPYILKNKTSI